MKKLIKKLCILATLSITPLALNSFNKPTFAMESTNSYSNFNEIKQNYETELKTMNEKIQKSIDKLINQLDGISENKSDDTNTLLNELIQTYREKYELVNNTIDKLSKLGQYQTQILYLFKSINTDTLTTAHILEYIKTIESMTKTNSEQLINIPDFKNIVNKIDNWLRKNFHI